MKSKQENSSHFTQPPTTEACTYLSHTMASLYQARQASLHHEDFFSTHWHTDHFSTSAVRYRSRSLLVDYETCLQSKPAWSDPEESAGWTQLFLLHRYHLKVKNYLHGVMAETTHTDGPDTGESLPIYIFLDSVWILFKAQEEALTQSR